MSVSAASRCWPRSKVADYPRSPTTPDQDRCFAPEYALMAERFWMNRLFLRTFASVGAAPDWRMFTCFKGMLFGSSVTRIELPNNIDRSRIGRFTIRIYGSACSSLGILLVRLLV